MLKNTIRKILSKWKFFQDQKLPLFLYKSAFLSSLYYFIFNRSFRRENQMVLSGKVNYIANIGTDNLYLLIRNTHRIEKGLLMIPRKDIFATNYIDETVVAFDWLVHNKFNISIKQHKWFLDVLTEYFGVVGSHPQIDSNRKKFIELCEILPIGSSKRSVPYLRNMENRSKISYEEFYKLNYQRRSVRWFLNRPVPRNLIDKAILAAIQAPSACNRQPFEFRVIDDQEMVREVSKMPLGTSGYDESIPVMIIVVGNLDAYFSERDRHLIYIDASLANMSLMLALETMGLSSCPINWPDIESRERKMAKFLDLQTYQRPVMCIALGYPDLQKGKVAFSEKRDLEEIRKYN